MTTPASLNAVVLTVAAFIFHLLVAAFVAAGHQHQANMRTDVYIFYGELGEW